MFLYYCTSPGPSGTLIWKTWLASHKNESPPANTKKRVALSKTQIQKVLQSTNFFVKEWADKPPISKYVKNMTEKIHNLTRGLDFVQLKPNDNDDERVIQNREDALTSLQDLVSLLEKPASEAEKKVKHAYSIILPHLNKAIDEKNKNGILNILNKLKEILHNLTDFTQESNVKNFEEKLQKSMETNAVPYPNS